MAGKLPMSRTYHHSRKYGHDYRCANWQDRETLH